MPRESKQGSRLLHFDPAAQSLFNQWYVANEDMLRRRGLGPAEQSHFAKYRSLVPGLALLFHLLEGHDGEVCSQCLTGALRYTLYLKSHAQRVYGAVTETIYAVRNHHKWVRSDAHQIRAEINRASKSEKATAMEGDDDG